MEVTKDRQAWRIGTARDTDWLAGRTAHGYSITVAIPPVFDAYATFHQPDGVQIEAHEHAVVHELIDLFFPADRSWLVSALWDDTWTCIGGPDALIDSLQHNALANARQVQPDQDALPPGLTRD